MVRFLLYTCVYVFILLGFEIFFISLALSSTSLVINLWMLLVLFVHKGSAGAIVLMLSGSHYHSLKPVYRMSSHIL